MSIQRSMRSDGVAPRAIAYGIPGERVDGNDVLAIYDATTRAVSRARAGQGPSLIEAITYRYKGHSKSDQNRYRTRDEIREWQRRDPIQRFAALLMERGILAQEDIKSMEAVAYQAIEDAYQFALGSPDPDPETLLEGVYA